ncbi:hypothetical protein [Kaarinaea lacus]
MAFFKTKASKRAFKIRLVLFLLWTLVIAWQTMGGLGKSIRIKQMLDNHEVAVATITDKKHSEVRTSKKRTSDVYKISYSFTDSTGTQRERDYFVDELEFERLADEKEIEVLYSPGKPEFNLSRYEVKRDSSMYGVIRGVVIVGGAAAFVLFVLSKFLVAFFCQEPAGEVRAGEIGKSYWLDRESSSNNLIFVTKHALVFGSADEKQFEKVKTQIANKTDPRTNKDIEFREVLYTDIKKMETKSTDKSIDLTFGNDDWEMLNFINSDIKAKALAVIESRVENHLVKNEEQFTPLRAARNSLLVFAVTAVLTFLFYKASPALVVVFGGLLLFLSGKSLVSRLLNPYKLIRWQATVR